MIIRHVVVIPVRSIGGIHDAWSGTLQLRYVLSDVVSCIHAVSNDSRPAAAVRGKEIEQAVSAEYETISLQS